MDTIILVPGGGGSRLTLQNQEIWPPTIPELVAGYNRTPQLLSSNVKVGTILDGIPKVFPCYGVYGPLQDDLAKIAKSCGSQFVNFPYDWRKDVLVTAADLAKKIKSCVKSSSDEITLVGHSMGNLLARIILESGDYSSKSWFGNIKRYVGICGPHYGVPVILKYTLGLSSWLGISASDMKALSKDPRYPSCYQCLPFEGKDVLFNSQSGTPQAKDFYTASVANDYDLDLTNLGKAKDVQTKLSFANKPTTVEYDLISGSSHTTDEWLEYDGPTSFVSAHQDQDGDSTIPLWSSKVLPYTQWVTPGDHVDILKSYPFKQILYLISGLQGSDPGPHVDGSSGTHNLAEQVRIRALRGNRDSADSGPAHAGTLRLSSDNACGRAGRAQVRALPGTTGCLSRPANHLPPIDHCGAGRSRRLPGELQWIARHIAENRRRFCGEQSSPRAATRPDKAEMIDAARATDQLD